jgi:hypothetical protein
MANIHCSLLETQYCLIFQIIAKLGLGQGCRFSAQPLAKETSSLIEEETNERRTSNIDGLVKSPKKANFKISHLIISIGYEIKI